jgi:hypothetical protein
VTASAEGAAGSNPVTPNPAVIARRPGLDLHAALSGTGVSPSRVATAASVQRAPEAGGGTGTEDAAIAVGPSPLVDAVPAHLPGLAVQRTLSAQCTLSAPTPHAALQLAPSQAPDRAAPAAQSSPPTALVALPSPPEPPAAVQRATSRDGAEHPSRERLSEAPDDEVEELADRLYDHIRARLRAELLIDRERAGLLADCY